MRNTKAVRGSHEEARHAAKSNTKRTRTAQVNRNQNSRVNSLVAARQMRSSRHMMVALLGCLVVLAASLALMVPAISMTHGDLVCGMEEHSHTEACYEQVLVCGLEEGEVVGETDDGEAIVHEHTADCYEKQLTCEKPVHKHTDACYAEAEEPAKDADKAAEEKADATAKDANDKGVEAATVADETDSGYPAQTFEESLKDKDGKITLTAYVEAPGGAFPTGTTMELKSLKAKDVESEVEAAISYDPELAGTVKAANTIAVNLTFKDTDGEKIDPAVPVKVKLTTAEVRDMDKPVLVHVLDQEKAQKAGKLDEDGNPKEAELVEEFDVVNQDENNETEGAEDTLKFEPEDSGEYAIVDLQDKETADDEVADGEAGDEEEPIEEATDGEADEAAESDEEASEDVTGDEKADDEPEPLAIPQQHAFNQKLEANGATYEVTVSYGDDAQIPEGAELRVQEIKPGYEAYEQAQQQIAENLAEGKEDIPANPALFDISIWSDGQEIEPAEGSQVQVKVKLVDGFLKGVYSDDASPVLINDQPVADNQSEMDKQVQVLHLADDAQVEAMETTDKIRENVVTSTFTTDSFSNWLVYLDEDLTDINVTTGDSLTLRPYTEWVWKATDEPAAYQGGQWTFPSSEWNTWTGQESGVQYTYYQHKTNGSRFRSFSKTDDQLHETYTVVTSVSLSAGDFDIQTNKGKTIHVHVAPGGSSPKPATVPGIPELTVNLFDYDVPYVNGRPDFTHSGNLDDSGNTASATNSSFYNASVNNGHDLKFLGWGASNNDTTYINNYTNEYINPGVVKDQLGTDGYPVVNNSNSQSLKYLFDTTSHNSNVYAFENAGGLFQKDNQGYYYYNSNVNYAEYDQSTNQFILYEHTYSQNTGGSNGANAKPFGFFPFHEYDASENAQPSMNHNKNLNHHFGMSMAVDFEIPQDRQMEDDAGNKHDIVYEFSGDDDLWVFVDDELVLDVGGIHQPVSGSINFTTGVITVHGRDDITKTFTVGAHTLKMFYMERGGCDSNLSVRFNLPLTQGKAELKVLKKSKTDDGQTPDQPLAGATFGIWTDASCAGDPYMVATSGSDGIVTFGNMPIEEAGQTYYLREIAPPTGFNRNPTIYTAAAVGPDGDGNFTFDVFPKNGSTMETDPVTHTPIVRDTRPDAISLSVEKKWQDAAGDEMDSPDAAVVFQVKRKYTWVEGSAGPENSIIRVYRVDSNWNNPRLMETREYAGNTTAYVNWTYSQYLWDGYKNWQYRVNNGSTQTKDENNPAQIQLPAGTTTNVYIFDGNLGGQYEQYGVENITVSGTAPDPGGGQITTGEGEDTEYAGPEIALPTANSLWRDTVGNLPVMEEKGSKTYYYEYYIVEKDPIPDGFEAVYLDGDGNPIANPKENATVETGTTQTVVNRKLLDVPIEKQWADYVGDAYTWAATFQLEQMEVKVNESDPDAPDAIKSFTPVEGKTLTIEKGQSPRPTFNGLPMYRVHDNGTVYRIVYSVSETAYTVRHGDTVVAQWSKEGGLVVGNMYTPQFEQDAGENGDSIDDYEIQIVNSLEHTTVTDHIALDVQKTWPSNSGIASDNRAYAKFVLKRQVHQEYRDYSNVSDDTEWVEITLDTWGNGTKLQKLRVPQGTMLHIVGSVKGDTNANRIVFTQSTGPNIEYIKDNTQSHDKFLFDIEFEADQTKTVALAQGDNYVVGGRDGFFLSDTYGNKTGDEDDVSFAEPFELNLANNWRETFAYLPHIVEQDVDPTEGAQTVYVYSYYLEEIESNPAGFEATFRDAQGYLLGDEINAIDLDSDITAENRMLVGDLEVTKDLIGEVTGNEDKQFKITIKNSDGKYLQSDKQTFGETPYEFSVSKSAPLQVSGIPVGAYMVQEVTDDGSVDIEGFNYNVAESIIEGSAMVEDGQTATVELKNYYNEQYTPEPSDTNEYTDLAVDKSWLTPTGGQASPGTEIKVKVKVKSADAYIPVKWDLYANGVKNDSQSGTYYAQSGSHVQFTMSRSDNHHSPGTSYWMNSSVALTNVNGGATRKYTDRIPAHRPQNAGAWNTQSNTYVFGTDVLQKTELMVEPWLTQAQWVSSLNGAHQWNMGVQITGGTYYTSVADMRDALIGENPTVEDLVYTLDAEGVHLVEDETSCSVRPESAASEPNSWAAVLNGLPTYLQIRNPDGSESYKVYSYEIEEIQVNGARVVDGRTDDYIVSVEQSEGVDGTISAQIANTEIEKVSVDATKEWLNADGSATPPDGATVAFELYADGQATGKTVVLDGKTREQEIAASSTMSDEEKAAAIAALDAEESGEFTAWKAEWRNLPKYSDDEQTQEIAYSVREVAEYPGYENQNPDGISAGEVITNKQRTAGFDVLKVAEDSGELLPGAKFTIQEVLQVSPTSIVAPVDPDVAPIPGSPEVTGADGKTSFENLTMGYYEVVEAETPAGYVRTGDGAFYVHVGPAGIRLLVKEIEGDGADQYAVLREIEGSTVGNVTIAVEDGKVTFTVENESGAALPHTGGPGTAAFAVFGALLVALAGAWLLAPRRKRFA